MFCRRKRPQVLSDSSDNDDLQPRKQLKLQNTGNPSLNGTRKRRLNSDFTLNLQQEGRVSNGDGSSSSDSEEILHPVKKGSVRALSDYETGDSTDKASRASSSASTAVTRLTLQDDGPLLLLSTSSQIGEISHSSSDTDVIQPTKRRKIQSNFVSSSDSSDSGVPIGFRRSTKQLKLPSSSEESLSDDSFESEPNRDSSRGNSLVGVQRIGSIRSTLGPVRSNVVLERRSPNRISLGQFRQQTRRSLRSRNSNRHTSSHIQVRLNATNRDTSSDENDSDFLRNNIAQIRGASRTSRRAIAMARRISNSDRLGPAGQRYMTRFRCRNSRQNSRNNVQLHSRRIPTVQESGDDYSSDSDIINNSLRHRRVPLIPSEDSSSTSDHRNDSQESRILRQSQSSSRIRAVSETEGDSTSESDIHTSLRHRRVLNIPSEDNNTSSIDSSDSSESVLIQNQVRRGALLTINESEEESNLTNATRNNTNYLEIDPINQKNSSAIRVSKESSSDSDGESEKCPICLIKFNLQEIGTPSSCNHNFCSVCLQEWAKNKNTCPVDRRLFNSIIVRAHVQGKILREVPVETPPPVENIVQSFLELWGNMNANNVIVVNERSSSSEFEDGPDETCCVCHRSHESENMILCDFCNNVYHMNCVNPPLQYVPAMDWFCPECVQNEMWPSESD